MALLPWEDQRLPVSMRLNNPGAMNFGPFARSMGGRQSGRFAQFDTPEAGWAAMDALLNSYRRRGFNTPSSIVGRWAPRDVDNNSTDSYIGRVAGGLGIGPNDPVPDAQWGNLAQLMADYEAGRSNPRPMALGGPQQPQPDPWAATVQPTQSALPAAPFGAGPLQHSTESDPVGSVFGTGQVEQPYTPPGVPPFQVTDIQPGSGELSTGDIVASMGPQPQPPGPDADSIMRQAAAAHERNNPPGPPEPGYLDRLLNNRAFLMGMSILGTPPGGNWGQSAINATRAHREGLEFERQQQQRSVMDRVWREAFPNGQPNPQHPLMQGIPPEMAATIHAMGPEQGLPQLQRFAFFRGQQAEQLQQRQRMLDMALNIGGGPSGPGGQPQQPQLGLPSMNPAVGGMLPDQPQTFDAAPLASPGMPWSVPDAQAAAPAPQAARAEPTVTVFGRQVPISQARTIAQALDSAGMRSEPLEQAITAAEAPQRAGETKLATEQAETQARRPQVRARLSDTLDGLEEMATRAEGMLNNPALPSTVGTFVRFRNVRGSAEYDLAAQVQTLQSMSGLRQLQALREAAGGAGASGLGSLSDRELGVLQSTIANLDLDQSPAAFRRQLQEVINFVRRARGRLTSAYSEQYNEPWSRPGGTAAPGGGEWQQLTPDVRFREIQQ